jgi:hypothetical protein
MSNSKNMGKNIAAFIVLSIIALGVSTHTAFAEGDKVRGDISDGPSCQLGTCPFVG